MRQFSFNFVFPNELESNKLAYETTTGNNFLIIKLSLIIICVNAAKIKLRRSSYQKNEAFVERKRIHFYDYKDNKRTNLKCISAVVRLIILYSPACTYRAVMFYIFKMLVIYNLYQIYIAKFHPFLFSLPKASYPTTAFELH